MRTTYSQYIHPGPVPSPHNHRAVFSTFAHRVHGIKIIVTNYRVMHMIVVFGGIPWEIPCGRRGIPRPPTWELMGAGGSPLGTTGLPSRARHHGQHEKNYCTCTLMCVLGGILWELPWSHRGIPRSLTWGPMGAHGSPRGTMGCRRMPWDHHRIPRKFPTWYFPLEAPSRTLMGYHTCTSTGSHGVSFNRQSQ